MKETLEEAAERLYPINKKGAMFMPTRFDLNRDLKRDGFIEGANWQSERMYSVLQEAISLLKGTTEYEVLKSFRQKVNELKIDK